MKEKLSCVVSQDIRSLLDEMLPRLALVETRQLTTLGLEEIITLTERFEAPLSLLKQSVFSEAVTLLKSVLDEVMAERVGYFSGLSCFLSIYEIFEEEIIRFFEEESGTADFEATLRHFRFIILGADEVPLSPDEDNAQESIIQDLAESVDLEILAGFISESEGELDTVESNLLMLEQNPTDFEQINPVFRIVHSIKGTAGFLQLKEMGELAHHAEDLLAKMRDKKIEPSKMVFNALFQSIDVLKQLFKQVKCLLQSADAEPVNIRIAHDLISDCLNSKKPAVSAAEEKKEPAPGASDPSSPPRKLGEILIEEGKISQEQLDYALNEQTRPPLGEILLNKGQVSPKDIQDALKKQSTSRKKTEVAELIKIPAFKLDELSELIGEMVVALSLLSQNILVDPAGERETLEKIDQLERITERLYDRILDMRMFPVNNVFSRLTRQVRDLSLKLDKKINLEMEGGDTLVDKRVIDSIYSPLMHLVRNAIDHGIESAEERKKSKKGETGSVSLAAKHCGDSIEIKVADDGGGLKREALLKKALEKQILREGDKLTDQQIFATIFNPGFSTAEATTDVSGRGVGMDVVKKAIEQLKGTIDIDSSPGVGTTFLISLPLNTSIIEGLIVRVGSTRFVLSILDVNQTVTPKNGEVKGVQGKEGEFFLLSGELVPIIRLYEFYDIQPEITDPSRAIIVVVNRGRRKYGLMVDDLLHRQQVVIKNMGERFKNLTGVTGGTILGDGRVGLILSPQELIVKEKA